METVVILPTYNERDNITEMITAVHGVVPHVHIMVVDDNSPDGTGKVVEDLQKENAQLSLLKRAGKEGLGRAYLHAFEEILAMPGVETIVMMDADFSHDPAHLPEMLAAARNSEVVIGSRYVRGGSMEGWEKWRLALSMGGNVYARLITGMPATDLTAGFYAINANALRRIDRNAIDSSGYAFQIELKYLLHKSGATFKEVPIAFKQRRSGESKMTGHIISEGIIAPWKLVLKK